MNVAETLLHAGAGSQSGASRWGDYSMMSVDPTDDTSFWYTTEYYATTASFDFNTRIVKFDLGGGGTGNIPPVASFTSSCTNLVCNFTDTSSDTDGSIVSRSWTFGDGGTSTSTNPSHTYAAAGTYTVGLTVTDNGGAANTTSQSVTVTSPGGGTMHIASITITAIKVAGIGGRAGRATVNVVDNNGAPVNLASVSGEFYGLFAQTPPADDTDASGNALFTTTTGASQRNIINLLDFCVNTITHASLTYTPANNVDPIFDCTVAPDAPETESASIAANNETSEAPVDFEIAQNYPNPFNPTTIIAYAVPEATDVTVKVFNMLGQEVATLATGYHDAGRYEVAFNANDLSAGIYLYTIKAGSVAITKRMTLLK
jgi:PKD repeat protein